MSAVFVTKDKLHFRRLFAAGILLLLVLLLDLTVGCDDEKTDARSEQDAQSVDAGDAQTGDPLLVKLDDGEILGEMAGQARRFLKIPYAKPPVGELRWKAPVPNDPWTDMRYETEFIEGCPQLQDQGAPASNNEDCLYLNVWSPNPPPEKAPVMVWIHGGGNFSGSASVSIPLTDQLWYDGQFLAANQGIVLVTLNYRLGPFGFFAHPALADEQEPVGNQGLYDQRLALTWVRDNIQAFGGDPNNVTIFGESAGSADVCYHMASPGSRDLFQKAISQSGGCTVRSTIPEREISNTTSQLIAYGEAVGCPAGDDQLNCLRRVSVEDLLANANQPAPGAGALTREGEWSFSVVIDGADGFLPDSPSALYDRGEIADVPYILGSNNDEGTTFVWRAKSLATEEQYREFLEQNYGDSAEEIAALYAPSKFDGDYDAARARVVGDASIVCGTYDTAFRAAKAGRKVFLYNFNVVWSIAPTLLFTGHAAEISHVFGSPYVPPTQSVEVTEASQKVADAVNAYWAQFAKTGDPNHGDAPAQWPQFTATDDKRLQLDSDWEVLNNFRAEECNFWRKYYGVL